MLTNIISEHTVYTVIVHDVAIGNKIMNNVYI